MQRKRQTPQLVQRAQKLISKETVKKKIYVEDIEDDNESFDRNHGFNEVVYLSEIWCSLLHEPFSIKRSSPRNSSLLNETSGLLHVERNQKN